MATLSEPKSEEFVRLVWSKDGRTVTVVPRDEDRFAIKRNKLVQFLKLAAQSEQFDQQLHLLFKILAEWLSERSGLKDAYLTFCQGAFSFVVVQSEVAYNAEFDDELASLDYDIAKDPDLDLITLNTLSLPPVEGHALQQFLDRNFTLMFNSKNGE